MGKRRRKIETSKLLLYICDSMTIFTVIGTFIAVFCLGDISPLAYLIPGVFALSGAVHGFYFWKAKAENLHKYGQDNKITMSGGDEYQDPDEGPAG